VNLPAKYDKLCLLVAMENVKIPPDSDGYAVFRGNDIDMLVANELMED